MRKTSLAVRIFVFVGVWFFLENAYKTLKKLLHNHSVFFVSKFSRQKMQLHLIIAIAALLLVGNGMVEGCSDIAGQRVKYDSSCAGGGVGCNAGNIIKEYLQTMHL